MEYPMPEVVTPGWKMELLQGAAEVGCQLFDGAAAQARTILIYYFDSCYFTTCQDAAGPATRPPFQHIIVQSAVVVEAFLYFYSHGFWFYCSNYFMYCSLHPPTNTTHHYFTINGWHSRRFNIFLSALL